MIKINLLPYREKEKKENISRQISIAVATVVLFILVLMLIHINLQAKVRTLETQNKEAENSLAILNKKIGDLEKYKRDKEELEQKLDIIVKLEENRLAPVKVLDELALLVPSKHIWLVKITQKDNQLTIEGNGRDNIAVANFMKIIENYEPIKSVDLISAKKTEIAGITFQNFTFSCVMKRGF